MPRGRARHVTSLSRDNGHAVTSHTCVDGQKGKHLFAMVSWFSTSANIKGRAFKQYQQQGVRMTNEAKSQSNNVSHWVPCNNWETSLQIEVEQRFITIWVLIFAMTCPNTFIYRSVFFFICCLPLKCITFADPVTFIKVLYCAWAERLLPHVHHITGSCGMLTLKLFIFIVISKS